MEKRVGEELAPHLLEPFAHISSLLLSCSAEFANQIPACLLLACPLEGKGREVIRGDLFQ